MAGALAGLLLGSAEAAETIADGFLRAYARPTHAVFAASCALLLAGVGAAIGLLAAGLHRQVIERLRAPGHLLWSVFMGTQLSWLIFLYAFKLFPLLGIAILPAGGLFNPVLPGTLALIALTAASFPAAVWALTRLARLEGAVGRRATLVVTLVSALLLYWQVSYALYAMSRISPADHLHTLSLVMLFLLVMSLVAAPLAHFTRCVDRRAAAVGATVLLLAAPVTHHIVGAHGSNTLRLLLHERTALTYRALEWLPRTYDTASMSDLSPASCDDLLSALAPPQPRPSAADSHRTETVRGVVLIMVDALRGDLIGAERDGVPLTPHLTELAGESLSFERAYATAAVTKKSAASMLTGHQTTIERISADSGAIPTLAPVLKRAAVETIAVPVHPMLDQAFDDFDILDQSVADQPDHRFGLTSQASAERILHHVEQVSDKERFFIFGHFYDPHWYYVPNELFYFGPTERDRYHAEIAYTDHWIGHMLEQLIETAHARQLAVIIVGDHGEEFWEHKYIQHVVRLYDESIRVPLIISHPHYDTPRRLDTPVSTTDIAPTILELLGLPIPPDMTGRPLFAAARADALKERPIRSSAPDKEAIIHQHHKLIFNTDTGIIELYDLDRDPREMKNLADDDPARVKALLCVLSSAAE